MYVYKQDAFDQLMCLLVLNIWQVFFSDTTRTTFVAKKLLTCRAIRPRREGQGACSEKGQRMVCYSNIMSFQL